MAVEVKSSTCGFDHVGLSVGDLAGSLKFFTDCLGWSVVGERPDYPAAFVSDGQGTITLWQVESPDKAIAFDRRANVGLHHLAIAVADRAELDALYQRVSSWPGVVVEFGPELSGAGPKIHFIVREPSGVRVEFTFDPRLEGVRKARRGGLSRNLSKEETS
jgi:catechol 2,3-dioxygenase-like lactoylglutathione lyase family enzyme